ncbi:phosphotransferase [Ammoniphilus sp. YIM 78166]|uniref:phosphotransferase n=1 Tax=Ammoniphilus sp. YIM 78166 TaxID=1644106 RepID=UPI00106F2751|nr:phosphotransferase [Ammoniphilus sp. YIM 78166]
MNLNIIQSQYPICPDAKLRIGKSGMNNSTFYIQDGVSSYVLRRYEGHKDVDKVGFEHTVLFALARESLPFHTPVPILTCDGASYMTTEEEKLVSLFPFIPGDNPTFAEPGQLLEFGRGTAVLTKVLSSVEVDAKPAYPPYYEMEVTKEVLEFCSNPPFPELAGELEEMGRQLLDFSRHVPTLRSLPHQLIHGDLNASNVLYDSAGKLTAILDFEFVTYDLRVMELAVCLSDVTKPGMDDELRWLKIEAYLQGYGSELRLSPEEIQVIPLLIQLRRLDVFVHFLGRYWDGVDEIGTVKAQIQSTRARTQWLEANRTKLMEMCYRLLG